MVSAVAASVTSSGAWVPANSAPTRGRGRLVVGARPRCGRGAGCRGRPCPRGGTPDWRPPRTSGRPRTCSTTRVEPTGTVDLLTTTAPCSRWRPDLLRPRPRGSERSADPSSPWGWARRGRRTRHPPPPRWRRPRTAAGPSRLPLAHQLVETVLHDGHLAPRQHGAPWPGRSRRRSPGGRGGPGRRGRQADVPGADDGDVVRAPWARPRGAPWSNWVHRAASSPPAPAPTGHAPSDPGSPARAPSDALACDAVSRDRRTVTSRASASASRERGSPTAGAALSSTELAGRGAGRGGSSSAVAMGSTRSRVVAGGRQDGPGEPEPGGHALVGDVEHARAAIGGQDGPAPGPGRR